MEIYYNKKGEAIGTGEWNKLLGDVEYKVIQQDVLPNGKWVSTVWLGLDHSFNGGKPLIFETMVFSEKGDGNELEMKRYSTEEEAIKGHKEMVKKWK